MATTQVPSDVPKQSFAKVAASASKEQPPIVTSRPVASPSKSRAAALAPPSEKPSAPVIANGAVGNASLPSSSTLQTAQVPGSATQQVEPKPDAIEAIVRGIGNTTLEPKTPSLVVNGSGAALSDKVKAVSGMSSSDESQKADSTSDLGAKPPSLDGKSITSGTTFALDEKESLRPDDSASVKAAAVEDDDAFSIRGSLLASSRMGSDLAGRRVQSDDNAERRVSQNVSDAQVVSPSQGQPGKQPPTGRSIPTDALNVIYRKAPDEKLLEAMQSPKDRIFLLRLEKDVVDFVQNSKEPYMDLPPCNSFCRMLTHKLADYYHMTHSYEPSIGAVRIFRTPFCRVPPSLASIVESNSATNTPPPAVIPRKIMRREDGGERTVSSAGLSKPTSEVGSDAKEKAAPAKEKMTREEREEAYNRARERIFGSSEKNGDSNQDNDNGVSRASSVSTKDKSILGRRGKNERRRRDSGSFESRTQYAVYYPGPQQSPWAPQPQYVPIATPFNGHVQQPYPSQGAPVYMVPGHGYPAIMPNPGYPPTYTNIQQFPPQPNQNRYPPPPGNNGIVAYGNVPPSGPPQHQQNWQSPSFSPASAPYPPRVPSGPPSSQGHMGPTPVGIPYPYGQLPANANPNDPKSQHPIPGSYNRHAFNPKTQSFVPTTGAPQMQGHPPSYPQPGSHHGSPQIPSPHMAYAGSGFQPVAGAPPLIHQQPYGAGFAMARQGSNNSMLGYHHSQQHMQHPHLPPGPPPVMPQQHMSSGHPTQMSNKHIVPPGSSVSAQTFNHLPPHYGNPATLPQKPT